jgi:hypothetical protein
MKFLTIFFILVSNLYAADESRCFQLNSSSMDQPSKVCFEVEVSGTIFKTMEIHTVSIFDGEGRLLDPLPVEVGSSRGTRHFSVQGISARNGHYQVIGGLVNGINLMFDFVRDYASAKVYKEYEPKPYGRRDNGCTGRGRCI